MAVLAGDQGNAPSGGIRTRSAPGFVLAEKRIFWKMMNADERDEGWMAVLAAGTRAVPGNRAKRPSMYRAGTGHGKHCPEAPPPP